MNARFTVLASWSLILSSGHKSCPFRGRERESRLSPALLHTSCNLTVIAAVSDGSSKPRAFQALCRQILKPFNYPSFDLVQNEVRNTRGFILATQGILA